MFSPAATLGARLPALVAARAKLLAKVMIMSYVCGDMWVPSGMGRCYLGTLSNEEREQ